MNQFNFKNSAGPCCPRDEDGNLTQPESGPVMRAPDGTAMDPPQAQQPTPEDMVPPSGQAQIGPNGIDPAITVPQPPGGDEAAFVYPGTGDFSDEAFRGSMQQILFDNLGQYVVCQFLIGTINMDIKEGILFSVGRSYVTLYDDTNNIYIVCDIFSIKFVTFYPPGNRPRKSPSSNIPTRR